MTDSPNELNQPEISMIFAAARNEAELAARENNAQLAQQLRELEEALPPLFA